MLRGSRGVHPGSTVGPARRLGSFPSPSFMTVPCMETVRQNLNALLAVSCLALRLFAVTPALAAAAPPDKSASESEAVDYLGQIKPILTRHCVACHGAVKPRGGLRLDTAAAALKGGKSGPAVIAGRGEESPLIAAVRGDGPGERMPLNRPPLAADEIKLLRDWIDQGARANPAEQPGLPPGQSHWAFVPPTRPTVPDVASPGCRAKPDRPIHSGPARTCRSAALRRSRPGDSAPPGQPRHRRSAAIARGSRRLPGRSVRVCL